MFLSWALLDRVGLQRFRLGISIQLIAQPFWSKKLFNYHLGPKKKISCEQLPSHTIWPIGHVVCIKTPKGILLGLFPTIKPKIQLSAHDVEFQRQKRTKSDRIIIDSP